MIFNVERTEDIARVHKAKTLNDTHRIRYFASSLIAVGQKLRGRKYGT